MASQRSTVVLSSLLILAVAAGAWLTLRGGDSGDGSKIETAGGAAGQPAASPAASLAAQGTAATRDKPTTGVARTEVRGESPAVSSSFRLTGRLLGVGSTPIASVLVGLSEVERGASDGIHIDLPDLAGQSDPTNTTHSSADGRFELRVARGHATSLRILGDTWYLRGKDAGIALDSLRVASLTADRDLGDLELGRCARLAGVVHNEVGKPVAGVQVAVATGREGIILNGLGRGLTSDGNGRFERQGLAPGKYTLRTASPDFLPAQLEVELTEGEGRAEVVIALRAGGTIAGIVVDDQGARLSGIKVAADRARELAPGVQVQSSSASEATTTDASGGFVLRGLESATVNVDAWGPGYAQGNVANVAAGTTDIVVRLERFGSVTGRVVDAAQAPVVGTRVTAERTSGGGQVFADSEGGSKTDADGVFVVERVRPGATRIVAEGNDHLRVESSIIDVQPGQRVEGVRLVVQRGAALLVKVTDAAGKPVAGARVRVTDPPTESASLGGGRGRTMRMARRLSSDGGNSVVLGNDTEHGSATTDAAGMARIGGLPVGSMVARVAHDQYAAATSSPVTIPEAGEVKTEVTVVAGGFVQLQALDAARDSLASANYQLQGPFVDGPLVGGPLVDGPFVNGSAPKVEKGKCDVMGLATIGPLAPGRWKARLRLAPRPLELGEGMSMVIFGDDGQELPETEVVVEVVAERTTPLTLIQPQLTTLRGTISDSTGRVGGAKIKLAQTSDFAGLGGGHGATADGSGAFELVDLPAGKYTLRYGYPEAVAMCEEPLEIVGGQALLERALILRTGTIKLIVNGEDGEPIAGARVTLEREGQRAGGQEPRREVRMVAVMRVDDSGSGGGNSTTSITSGGASKTTDSVGEVEITRVPAGQYTLRVEHAQHVTGRKTEVKVLDGATMDVGIVKLAAGGELRGRVTSADGKAVGFAQVEISPLPSGETRTETAMNGSFRITGLAAGSYRVRAETLGGAPGDEGGRRSSAPVPFELGKGERKSLDLQVK